MTSQFTEQKEADKKHHEQRVEDIKAGKLDHLGRHFANELLSQSNRILRDIDKTGYVNSIQL